MFWFLLFFALPISCMQPKRSLFINYCRDLIKGNMLVEEIPSNQFLWADVDGKTLMHYATFYDGNGSLIETLYKACPELLEKKDHAQYTPLHTAAFHGNPRAVEALLAQGASHSPLNHVGKTPAHLVITLNNFPAIKIIIRQLINAGASVNAQDVYGNTPLHYCALQGDEKLYQYILGLTQWDITIKNRDNYTAEYLFITAQIPRAAHAYIELMKKLRYRIISAST